MIDVHIHAVPPNLPGAGPLSLLLKQSPAEVAAELRRQMQLSGTTHALAMGEWNASRDDPLGVNRTLEIAAMVSGLYAIGVADPEKTGFEHFHRCETMLATKRIVALKAYLGYLHYAPSHPHYQPYYELAARHRIPVYFHTGDTYSPMAKLKYAHPLGVDEVAVDHPETRFIICHLGNPWMLDAAQVVYKNMNVWADLSGLIVGDADSLSSEESRDRISDLAADIRRAMRYSERPNRFLYGTDWPLAPMTLYRDFIRDIVPSASHAQVFEENARVLFRLE